MSDLSWIALPPETMEILKKVYLKTGSSYADLISEGIMSVYKKNFEQQPQKKDLDNPKKIRIGKS